MQKYTITNRSGLKISIQVDSHGDTTELVFIEHGQKGNLNQVHIQAFADAFLENGYRVVRFDATHALGESDGNVQSVTYDSYITDLEDVIDWAKNQDWFQAPFALCGHSMGAQSVAWYAEQYPDRVNLLLPMAPTINFDLWASSHDEVSLSKWKELGYSETISRSTNQSVRVGWQVNESLKKFDILPKAEELTMPILNIVGELDMPCPPKNQEIFMSRTASVESTFVVLSGLEHSYRNAKSNEYDEGLKKVKETISDWLVAHG